MGAMDRNPWLSCWVVLEVWGQILPVGKGPTPPWDGLVPPLEWEHVPTKALAHESSAWCFPKHKHLQPWPARDD